MSDRIMIFVPAYNCEKQLPRVLAKIDARIQALVREIVVIDNRSADATLAAGLAAARNFTTKVTFLRNKQNFSLGGSIKRAFLYAIDNHYDYMITLHGDDQADIRDLLPTLESGAYRDNDLTIGARFHPQSTLVGYSRIRILGNRALNAVCSLIAGRRVDDLIAGLNIFRVGFFREKFFLRFPDNLTFDAHLLLYAFSRNAKVAYLPISWREEDQVSNAKVFRQSIIILRLLLDYVVKGAKIFATDKSGRPDGFRYESEVAEPS
jgi:glycosyltransferase involved in cell wall biosynthesis